MSWDKERRLPDGRLDPTSDKAILATVRAMVPDAPGIAALRAIGALNTDWLQDARNAIALANWVMDFAPALDRMLDRQYPDPEAARARKQLNVILAEMKRK